ncbi:MAG: protein kinase [Planctomycetota bacterium]
MIGRLKQLAEQIESGSVVDLRELLRGSDPGDEAIIVSVIERYTEWRIEQSEAIDFEEYRRAAPWIFESPKLLRSAIESVLYTAIAIRQSPVPVGRAIARAHPLAKSTVDDILHRFIDADGYVLPAPEIRPLPCRFGLVNLDGEPRYTLVERVRRGRGYGIYKAKDSMADRKRSDDLVLLWIGLHHDRAESDGEIIHRAIPKDVVCRSEFLGVREDGIAPSGEHYAALEYDATLRPLTDFLSETEPDTRSRIKLVRDIARACEQLHAVGFVHGDVTPRNIFVNASGGGVLCVLPGDAPNTQECMNAHQSGPEGMISFVSPEQYRQETNTPLSDVYFLGATLLFCLGNTEINGSTSESAHDFLESERNVSTVRPERCPAEIYELILRCASRSPAARPVSATIVRESLDRWLNGRPVHDKHTTLRDYVLFAKRNSLYVAASLLILLASAGLLSLMSHQLAFSAGEARRIALATDLEHTAELQALAIGDLQISREREHKLELRAESLEQELEQLRSRTSASIRSARNAIASARSAVNLNEEGHHELLLLVTSMWQTMAINEDAVRRILDDESSRQTRDRADELWASDPDRLETAFWQLVTAQKMVTVREWDAAEKYFLRAERSFGRIDASDDTLLNALRDQILSGQQSETARP